MLKEQSLDCQAKSSFPHVLRAQFESAMRNLANRSVYVALVASLGLHILLLDRVVHGRTWRGDAGLTAAHMSPMQVRVATLQSSRQKVAIGPRSADNPRIEAQNEAEPVAPAPGGIADETAYSNVSKGEGGDWLSFMQAYYFKSDALTRRPAYLRDLAPQASAVVPDFDPQPLVATLLINELGRVDEVIMDEGALSQQAKLFVSNWFSNIEFAPGMIGNIPVKTQMTIEVRLDAILTLQ